MTRCRCSVVSVALVLLHGTTLASASNGMEDILRQRDNTKTVTIPFYTIFKGYYGGAASTNESDVYIYTNVTVGTPGQAIPMSINFQWGDSFLSSNGPGFIGAPFTSAESSPFELVPYSAFNQTNGPGQWYTGNYSTDVLGFNSYSFPNFTFALMDPRNDQWGENSLGLGAKLDEGGISFETEPTLLSYAVNKGLIQTTAYSFWLDNPSEVTPAGQILLGGIDTGKFQGGLVTLDTTLSSDKAYAATELAVALTSLSVSPNGNLSHQIPLEAINAPLLNPATGPLTLPPDIVTGVWTALGASFDKSVEPHLAWPIVDCSYTTNTSTLNLAFGSDMIIPVSISDLTIHNGTGIDNQDGANGEYCRLDIQSTWNNSELQFNSLGSAALKQMYTVFDLNLNQLSFGLRNASSTVTNIVEIGPSGVPALNLNLNTTTPTPTPAPKSHTLAIALEVAIPVGVILIAGIIAGFLFLRRRKHRHAPPDTASDPHVSYPQSEGLQVTGLEKQYPDASPGPTYTISSVGSPPIPNPSVPGSPEVPSELPDHSARYSELPGVSAGAYKADNPAHQRL